MGQKLVFLVLILTCFQGFSSEIRMRKEGSGFMLLDDKKPVLFLQRHADSLNVANYFQLINPISLKKIVVLKFSWQDIQIDNTFVNPFKMENFSERVSDLEFVQQKDKSGILSYHAFWKENDNSKDPFLKISTQMHLISIENNIYQLKVRYTLKSMDGEIVLPIDKKSFPNGLFIKGYKNAITLDGSDISSKECKNVLSINSVLINHELPDKAKWDFKEQMVYLQQKKQKKWIANKSQPIEFEYLLTFKVNK